MLLRTLGLISLIGLLAGVGLAGIDSLPIPETQAPKLDGVVDDACWEKALKIDKLNILSAEIGKTSDETVFYLCRDKAWLYIAAQCVNKEMQHVEQTVFEHDGSAYLDESVEIFIDPGTGGKETLQFMLSFAGVKADKSFGLMGANPQSAWDCPWRSVTRRLPEGWEAEIAIPLFALKGKLAETRINLLRNRIVPEIDTMGAKQGEHKEHYVLAAGKNVKDASQYVKLEGLDEKNVELPFAPNIDSVKLGVFEQGNDGFFYPIRLALSPTTAVGGEAEIWVIETQDGNVTEHKCQMVALNQPVNVAVKTPLTNFNARAIVVALRDKSGSLLASANIADSSMLAIVKDAFVGRSYYTTEQNAELKIEFGISDKILEKITLRATVDGKVLFEKANPESALIAELPLKDLKIGRNQARLSVMENGRELYGADYEIVKLEPKPDCEVKADFIRKTLLKDGEPFFVLSIIVHNVPRDERHFKKLSELGFNTVQIDNVGEKPHLLDFAAKYGLQVTDWGIDKLDFNPRVDAKRDLQSARKNYEKALPKYRQAAQVLNNHTNFLMRFQVDEPNLDAADINVKVMGWFYKDVREIDPYRPFLLNFSKYLPSGKEWTDYAEILSDDIYPRPWTGAGLLSEPGLGQAYYANKLRQRCEKDHKLMFMVPLAGQHSVNKGPLGMTRQQTLCQNYVNLIYGVKGLNFFCLTTPSNYDTWNAIQMLNEQIKQLSPALLNYEVKQNVTYPDYVYEPDGAGFPQVLGRVFQYPDGDYIVLAVNLRHFAADVRFQLPGATGITMEFGGNRRLSVEAGTFTDRLEPFGTRAYRIQGVIKAPAQLAITAKADRKEQTPSVDVQGIIRQMRLGKNYCPNPCFERQLIPGSPDFHRPFIWVENEVTYEEAKKGSVWYVDDEVKWNGRPSLRMDSSRESPRSRGVWSAVYPPQTDKPVNMVFSFYAKGARDGDEVSVLLEDGKGKKSFKLTTDWQRIVMPITVPAKQGMFWMFLIMPNGLIWISGLQLEAGDTPTEFQDDSVLQEITINEDPANLVKNGHAEYGDTRFWQVSAKGTLVTQNAKSGKFAFCFELPAVFDSNLFPIDPTETYELSGQFKAEGNNPRLVFGLLLYDAEKRMIAAHNVNMIKGTDTELASPATQGDKVLQVKDASQWKPSYRVAFEPEKGLPVFNVSAPAESIFQSGETWSIRLSAPCVSNYPAGTRIMASVNASGMFPYGLASVPSVWTQAKGMFTPAMFERWPGAKYASVSIRPKLPNHPKPHDTKIMFFMDDISFKPIQASKEHHRRVK